jgi:putative oxidoreductase
MAGAVAVHRPGGFFAMKGGYEYPAYLGFMAAALGLSGPGRYSFDHLTGHRLDRPVMVVLAFAASVAGAAAVVSHRESALAAEAEAAMEEAEAESQAQGPAGSA